MSKNIICMLHIISLCAQVSQNVKYWYEKCDVLVPIFTRCKELVPIFHSVKFAKCEICGSTGLQCHLSPAQGHRLQVNISLLMFYGEMTKLFNYHKIGSFITPDRRQSKTL